MCEGPISKDGWRSCFLDVVQMCVQGQRFFVAAPRYCSFFLYYQDWLVVRHWISWFEVVCVSFVELFLQCSIFVIIFLYNRQFFMHGTIEALTQLDMFLWKQIILTSPSRFKSGMTSELYIKTTDATRLYNFVYFTVRLNIDWALIESSFMKIITFSWSLVMSFFIRRQYLTVCYEDTIWIVVFYKIL